MCLDNSFRYCQTEPGTLSLASGGVLLYLGKFVEDQLLVFRRNANARVLHRNLNYLRIWRIAYANVDPAAFMRELDGIPHKIDYYLLDTIAVDQKSRQPGWHFQA